MELNVNSPAYFTQQFGVDDEVYRMCRETREFLQDKEYSEVLQVIGILPVADDKQIGPVVEVADDVLQIFLFVESGTWKQNRLTAQKRDALLKRDPCADAGFREK